MPSWTVGVPVAVAVGVSVLVTVGVGVCVLQPDTVVTWVAVVFAADGDVSFAVLVIGPQNCARPTMWIVAVSPLGIEPSPQLTVCVPGKVAPTSPHTMPWSASVLTNWT